MVWIGAAGLTISAVGQLIFAGAVLWTILGWGKPAPILYVLFEAEEVQRLDPAVLSATRTLAIYFQTYLASFAILKLAVIWGALIRHEAWALWALGAVILVAQTGAFLADASIGHRSLPLNILQAVLQAAMWALAAWGIYFSGKTSL